MTDLAQCLNKLQYDGYTDEYKVENGALHCISNDQYYKPEDIKVANFYRFEGISAPEDMEILYAIETNDGRKGTLVDAYGLYAVPSVGQFMLEVEKIQKVVNI